MVGPCTILDPVRSSQRHSRRFSVDLAQHHPRVYMKYQLKAALLALLLAVSAACGPRTLQEKLVTLADQTRVCVDNSHSFHTMNVRIAPHGHGGSGWYGKVYVRSGDTACEWMSIKGGQTATVDATIESTSVNRDVTPPAWRKLMVEPGVTVILVVGADGTEPFQHSSRRRD